MVKFGKDNSKDELFNEMINMLQNILDHEFVFNTNAVSENEVNQLVRECRGVQSSDKTIENISNALLGGRHAG